jgi:thiamine-phosphate pyrophosphorylase
VAVLCYITDSGAFAGDEPERRRKLLGKVAEAARCGVDYIQLREKDLSGRDLEFLAREVVATVREHSQPEIDCDKKRTVVLINARTDVALIAGVDGVHLRSDDVSPKEVRAIWKSARSARNAISPHFPLISAACHSPAQVAQAAADGADLAIFAPVFEKKDSPATTPAGLLALREACRAKIPVLALGGVTFENAQACLDAGAAGIAAIRLFQENEIAEVVRLLH